ncbi:hypothetical protein AB0J72_01700 [Dactylosporangium sp. NPDC049742]
MPDHTGATEVRPRPSATGRDGAIECQERDERRRAKGADHG